MSENHTTFKEGLPAQAVKEGFYLSDEGEWIPDGWEINNIEELCSLIVDCVNKTAPKVESITNYQMIRTTNIRHGRLNLSDAKFVTEDTFTKWTRRAILKKNDVLLTREAPIGEVCRIDNGKGLFLGQRIMQYRANSEVLYPPFLYWSFRSAPLRAQFLMHEGSGSVVSHIRVGDCFKFKVPTPPLSEQKAIAAVLGSLDDKIELLREQNETLETLAQTLFKRWFIDFNFPDKNGKPYKDNGGNMIPSELGEIPEGWRVGKLSESVEVKYGKDHKKLEEGPFPCYGSGGIMRYVESALCSKTESVLIPRKGTLSNLLYVRAPFWSVDTMFFTEFSKNNFVKYFFLKMKRIDLAEMNVGSAVPSMTTAVLNDMAMLYPDEQALEMFESLSESVFLKIDKNTQQVETLILLRDALLPKLMKGEIRIK